jgi:hypothetical protein
MGPKVSKGGKEGSKMVKEVINNNLCIVVNVAVCVISTHAMTES